jgi:hypothetical protein
MRGFLILSPTKDEKVNWISAKKNKIFSKIKKAR